GGVDLLGARPDAAESAYGLPKAEALYGPLPRQLKDPDSFASRLRRLLAARKAYRVAEAELLAAPEPKGPAVGLLVLRLPAQGGLAVSAVNFGRSAVVEEIDLTKVRGVTAEQLRGGKATDIVADRGDGEVAETGRLTVRLDALSGKTLVVRRVERE